MLAFVPRIALAASLPLPSLYLFGWFGFGWLGSLGACTTTNVAEPADATSPGTVEQQADVAEADASPRPTVPATAPATPAAAKPTQPYNCQAPLVVIEEVTRLLTVAGTHATRSAACVDGPGQRVTLDEILVCPLAPDGTRRPFGVTYRVSTWEEGGRRVCDGKCPPVEPAHTFHRIDVVFVPHKDGHVIELPKSTLPGLPLDASALAAAHDGDCYGKSPAFEPRPIALR